MFNSQFELFSYKITPINIIDILLVVFLCFQLFKLLKGSLAFNILIGLITIYMFWLAVRYFEMPLMSGVLGEFAKVGIINNVHQEIINGKIRNPKTVTILLT